MLIKPLIPKGEQEFVKGHVGYLGNVILANSGNEIEVFTLQLEYVVGADTVLRRLLERDPRRKTKSVHAIAGCKVSRAIYSTAMRTGHQSKELMLWLPAFWTFGLALCDCFLEEVADGCIKLRTTEERRTMFIASQIVEHFPDEFVETVMCAHETHLVAPVLIKPDLDLYPRGPRGMTIH